MVWHPHKWRRRFSRQPENVAALFSRSAGSPFTGLYWFLPLVPPFRGWWPQGGFLAVHPCACPLRAARLREGGLFSPSVSFTLIVFILWYGGCCKVNKVNINNNNCVELRRVNRSTLLNCVSYSNISYLFGAIYLHQGEHIFNRFFFWTSWWTTRTWRVMHFTKIYLYIF